VSKVNQLQRGGGNSRTADFDMAWKLKLPLAFFLGALFASANSQAQPVFEDSIWDSPHVVGLPLKAATEGLVLLSWNVVYGRDYFTSEKITSDKIKPGLELIDSAVLAMRDPTGGPRQARVERLLNELRPFSYSRLMSACYSVSVTESTQFNGFNTGCHIFVTKQMVDLLNDDQLRAVLAHEMSHGEVGDLVRTYGSLARAFFAHVRTLMGEEMIWAFTGEVQPYNQKILDAVQKPGDTHLAAQMQMIMQAFSETAERVEIRADVNATKILEKSGHSGEDLASALQDLTKAAFEQKQKHGGSAANKDVRGYPKLQTRISAIREARQAR
jgi:Zn-dependent protease with chaperone function